jgi:hypothetical protein
VFVQSWVTIITAQSFAKPGSCQAWACLQPVQWSVSRAAERELWGQFANVNFEKLCVLPALHSVTAPWCSMTCNIVHRKLQLHTTSHPNIQAMSPALLVPPFDRPEPCNKLNPITLSMPWLGCVLGLTCLESTINRLNIATMLSC